MSTGELLDLLGFSQIGEVVDQRMVYSDAAPQRSGTGNAVYVFLNTDDTVWKVGMTRRGFSRTDYSGVLDGRKMKRPNEQRKLELIRAELHDGATQWVRPTEDDPVLLEDLLIVMLNPTESRRQRSKLERSLREYTAKNL